MTRGINELKPKRVTEIASRLRFLSFAIFEAYVSEDGRHIDYKSIHGCEEFRRLVGKLVIEYSFRNFSGVTTVSSFHLIISFSHLYQNFLIVLAC